MLEARRSHNHFRRNQVIFHEGGLPTGLFIISSGKVKLSKLGASGREQIVRLAREGEVLGYRSMLSREAYSATATALENVEVCFAPSDLVFHLMERNHMLCLNIMDLLSHDLKVAENRLTHLAQDTVRERVAQTLMLLRQTYGLGEDGKTLNITLSREDLARIVGTATESVIRFLSEFQKDGMIELSRKKILILDEKKLSWVGMTDD